MNRSTVVTQCARSVPAAQLRVRLERRPVLMPVLLRIPVPLPAPVPEPVPVQEAAVFDRQIRELLGPVATHVSVSPTTRRRPLRGRASSLHRAGMACVLLSALAVAGAIVQEGLARRTRNAQSRLVERLQNLLRLGSYAESAEVLASIPAGEFASALDSRVVARAEATLYSSFDGDPARFTRALTYLRDDDSDDAWITRALLSAESERIELLDGLSGAQLAVLRDDAEGEFLIATALARADFHADAELYFSRALAMDPAHRIHHARAEEHSRENIRSETSDNGAGDPPVATTSLDLPPVARAKARIDEAISLFREGRLEEAHGAILAAIAIVPNFPPILIDSADRFLTLDLPLGARIVIDESAWPRDRALAIALEGRLALAENDAPHAVALLGEAFSRGVEDPRTSVAYAEALERSPHRDGHERPTDVLGRIVARWPERADLALRYARALVSETGFAEAQSVLLESILRSRTDPENEEQVQWLMTTLSSKPTSPDMFKVNIAKTKGSKTSVAKRKVAKTKGSKTKASKADTIRRKQH